MASKQDLDANAEFIRLADVYEEVPGGTVHQLEVALGIEALFKK